MYWYVFVYFGSGLSAPSCMKEYVNFVVVFFFFFVPLYSRSRDGISPAVLPVGRAAVILKPHFRQTPNQNSEGRLFLLTRLCRPLQDLERLTPSLPLAASVICRFVFFPPHQFFYSHALLCRAYSFTHVHYSFLPAHRQRKRWRGWTDDSSRDKAKTWKTTTENVIFLSVFDYVLSASLILCYDTTVDLSHRD